MWIVKSFSFSNSHFLVCIFSWFFPAKHFCMSFGSPNLQPRPYVLGNYKVLAFPFSPLLPSALQKTAVTIWQPDKQHLPSSFVLHFALPTVSSTTISRLDSSRAPQGSVLYGGTSHHTITMVVEKHSLAGEALHNGILGAMFSFRSHAPTLALSRLHSWHMLVPDGKHSFFPSLTPWLTPVLRKTITWLIVFYIYRPLSGQHWSSGAKARISLIKWFAIFCVCALGEWKVHKGHLWSNVWPLLLAQFLALRK